MAAGKRVTGTFVALFLALLGILSRPDPTLSAGIAVTQPTGIEILAESSDFATLRFADPWDMSSSRDLYYGAYFNEVVDVSWRGGQLSGRSSGTDAYVHPLFPGYRDAVPMGRDGAANRIDTGKFNRFAIRLYSSRRTVGQVFWFYNQVWTDFGSKIFTVEPGWNIYIVNPADTGRWTGRPMGFRVDPSVHDGVTFKIDWIRLYQQTSRRVTLAWTDSSSGGTVDIYLDDDTNADNGNLGLIASQSSAASNTYRFDPSPYPRGRYYFFLREDGDAGVFSNSFEVSRPPLTVITDPDSKGGDDYATVTGNPWDMSSRNDLDYWVGLSDVAFNNGIMSGRTASSDGYFHLRVPTPIDTNRFHRLTFKYRYDGSFDFGAGTISRYIWSPDPFNINLYQTLDDIVVYPRWITYFLDLKKAKLDSGNIGWNGQMVGFRFDPLELAGRRFYVDYIRLAADDRADRSFMIKWRDARGSPRPTNVSIFYDTNQSGFDGRVIVRNRQQVSGVNTYSWNTTSIASGTYFIYTVADDGVGITRKYSTGPLIISH